MGEETPDRKRRRDEVEEETARRRDRELEAKQPPDEEEHVHTDQEVEEAIDESFPASDPPSWTRGQRNEPVEPSVPLEKDRPSKPGGRRPETRKPGTRGRR